MPHLRPICLPALAILLTGPGCGVHYLRPPPPPPRATPPPIVAPRTPAPGEGLVTIEVLGPPARIDRILGRQQADSFAAWGTSPRSHHAYGYGPSIQTEPLCLAPCTVALPLGDQELQFTALDPESTAVSTAFVRIGPQPLFVRHAIGQRREHVGSVVASALLGGLGAGALLTAGGLFAIDAQRTPGQAGLAPAAWTVLGTGALLSGVAIWLGLHASTEVQPGATSTFPLEPAPVP